MNKQVKKELKKAKKGLKKTGKALKNAAYYTVEVPLCMAAMGVAVIVDRPFRRWVFGIDSEIYSD